nr:hypothetical protein [uncultured Thiocystis sp.]
MLQGQTPQEVSLTELGARRIETLLWKLLWHRSLMRIVRLGDERHPLWVGFECLGEPLSSRREPGATSGSSAGDLGSAVIRTTARTALTGRLHPPPIPNLR